MDRRTFLARGSLALSGVVVGSTAACNAWEDGIGRASDFSSRSNEPPPEWDPQDWGSIRDQFVLSDEYVHLSALLIASHPGPVRTAIAEHREGLDRDPALYLQRNNPRLEREVLSSAADYMGVESDDIALTDSTTMGLGILYNGLRLKPGQEILTTEHDYYATHAAVRTAAERSGATWRKITLFESPETATQDEIATRIGREIRPRTRVLAVTWVHSGTGLKLPLPAIAEVVARANEDRDEEDRLLLCVDGVHGFGVEDARLPDLGCDFFAAGCHKWLFGPRGTGILWGADSAWDATLPVIPSFMDSGLWTAWMAGEEPEGPTNARRMSPGGFKAFEHRWSLGPAFEFHRRIGSNRIAERTHDLATRLKAGLAEMDHVRLVTPGSTDLSSGLVCFDVDGMSPGTAVDRLRAERIVGTVTPYSDQYVRLAPCLYNTPEEVERAVQMVAGLT